MEFAEQGWAELKQAGNAQLAAGSLTDARESYTAALAVLPPAGRNRALVLSNRAAVLLKESSFESALADATAAIEADASYEKGHHRAAAACTKLGQAGQAGKHKADANTAQRLMGCNPSGQFYGTNLNDFAAWETHRSRLSIATQQHFYDEYPNHDRRSKEEATEVHSRCGAAQSKGHELREKRGGAYLDYLKRNSDHNYSMLAHATAPGGGSAAGLQALAGKALQAASPAKYEELPQCLKGGGRWAGCGGIPGGVCFHAGCDVMYSQLHWVPPEGCGFQQYAEPTLVGSRVTLHGLQSAAAQHRNGTGGLVQTFDSSRGRYAVLLDDGSTLALKPANLEADADADDADTGWRDSVVDLVHMDFNNPRNGRKLISSAQLGAVLDGMEPTTRHVFLHGIDQATAAQLASVASRQLSNLLSVSFSECLAAGDGTAQALAKHCPQLRGARFGHTALGDAGVAALAAGCARLQWLDLFGCEGLSDGALRALGSGVCATALRVLLAGFNNGSKGALSKEGVLGAEALRHCTSLEVLHISRGSMSVLDIPAVAELLAAGVPLRSVGALQASVANHRDLGGDGDCGFALSHPKAAALATSYRNLDDSDGRLSGSQVLQRLAECYPTIAAISLHSRVLCAAGFAALAASPVANSLQELDVGLCPGVGNPGSLRQIARLRQLRVLNLFMDLGYGCSEHGDSSDKDGNTRELVRISEQCKQLCVLDVSFNEETIQTMGTVVKNLPQLHTIVLKACYGGVEYPGCLEREVKRQGGAVRPEFECVWDRN